MWDGSAFYYDANGNGSEDAGERLNHHGWDTVDDDNDPTWESGGSFNHGTQSAGVVVGDGTQGTETGVAPEATVMLIRNVGTGFDLNLLESDMMAGFDFLLDMKNQYGAAFDLPDIITMSASMKFDLEPDYEAWREITDQIWALGIVHINSIGNDGNQSSETLECVFGDPDGRGIPYNIATPGNAPSPWMHPDQPDPIPTAANHLSSAIAVGAVNENDVVRSGSSRGPATWENIQANYPCQDPIKSDFWDYLVETSATPNGLLKPDVAAPSVVPSTIVITQPGGTAYGDYTGTSSATPHVAGAAALMLSVAPDLTPKQVAKFLQQEAFQPSGSGKNNNIGSGRIDAYKAVIRALKASDKHEVFDVAGGVLSGTKQGKSIWILAPTEVNGTLSLLQDAAGNPSVVYVISTLTIKSTAVVHCDEATEFIQRGGELVKQQGATIDMNCLNACMLAEKGGKIRFKSGATQSFSNLAFMWNGGGTIVLKNNAVIDYKSSAKPFLIDPGSVFELNGSAKLKLQRHMDIEGEAGNEIRFEGGTVNLSGNASPNEFDYVIFDGTNVNVKNSITANFRETTFDNASLTIKNGTDVTLEENTFTNTDIIINSGGEATMVDAAEIRLKPGFHARQGSTFRAYIGTASKARLAQTPVPSDEQAVAERSDVNIEPRTGQAHAQETLQETGEAVPTVYSLAQNYPNPFNPTTTISYALKEQTRVTLKVYDALGRVVATLVDEVQPAGSKTAVWSARTDTGLPVPSGTYLYRLVAGDYVQARTMVLLR